MGWWRVVVNEQDVSVLQNERDLLQNDMNILTLLNSTYKNSQDSKRKKCLVLH